MRHVLAGAALTALAALGALTPSPRPAEPMPRAYPICLSTKVSGVVNQATPPQCVDQPIPTMEFHRGVGQPGTLYVEVWTHHP